ncbi:hypothetical protein DYBT9275_01861 [Dyadobacter sp. CECT 9275]|uniref:Lipoprotein n=1 Tax=Dyadobacter helix TaxID=2822344 RepID=A0A916N3U5_9BACT|nr:hypothetical protein [Dyadobacter sp. CECT 9275]CAG4997837.1 hypothetical protein DYBT9275_01861 [Dyadobacter sp. CECT 9275]
MKRIGKYVNGLLALSVLSMFSCQKKEATPACGCGDVVIRKVEKVEAVHYGRGIFGIREKGTNGNTYQIVEACEVDSSWAITGDVQQPDFIITGNLKRSCGRPDGINTMLWIGNQPIEINEIKFKGKEAVI